MRTDVYWSLQDHCSQLFIIVKLRISIDAIIVIRSHRPNTPQLHHILSPQPPNMPSIASILLLCVLLNTIIPMQKYTMNSTQQQLLPFSMRRTLKKASIITLSSLAHIHITPPICHLSCINTNRSSSSASPPPKHHTTANPTTMANPTTIADSSGGQFSPYTWE